MFSAAPMAEIAAKVSRPHTNRRPFSRRSLKVKMLLSRKLPRIATAVATVCATANSSPKVHRHSRSTSRCAAIPTAPTPANSTKRTGRICPISLSTISSR